MKWRSGPAETPPPVVLERIRPVEVPVITEAKRRVGREDVAGALLFVYPKVVEDLGRAYGVPIPVGYSHTEIVAKCFNEAMAGSLDFFDRLYRLYAPVRYGGRAPPGSGDDLLELLQSLYGAEPMWRLYLANGSEPASGGLGATLSGLSGRATEG